MGVFSTAGRVKSPNETFTVKKPNCRKIGPNSMQNSPKVPGKPPQSFDQPWSASEQFSVVVREPRQYLQSSP